MATTPQHPAPKHPATPPTQRPNQPQGSTQQRPQHEDPSKSKDEKADVNKGRDPDAPSGVAADYDTKPRDDEHGGDQSPHPSPATDPTNAAPEPAQWSDDNPRPPLPKGRDYVAGQPVTQEEYELTEKEQAERVRPEAWERLEGQGVQVQDGQKDASVGWSRDKEGTRPDARPLRDPASKDDDVNKAPGGAWRAGARAPMAEPALPTCRVKARPAVASRRPTRTSRTGTCKYLNYRLQLSGLDRKY